MELWCKIGWNLGSSYGKQDPEANSVSKTREAKKLSSFRSQQNSLYAQTHCENTRDQSAEDVCAGFEIQMFELFVGKLNFLARQNLFCSIILYFEIYKIQLSNMSVAL